MFYVYQVNNSSEFSNTFNKEWRYIQKIDFSYAQYFPSLHDRLRWKKYSDALYQKKYQYIIVKILHYKLKSCIQNVLKGGVCHLFQKHFLLYSMECS